MTRLAYLALGFFAGVVITLSLRREPTCPTCDAVERGLDDARTGQTVTWDEADDMCPNCVTPWKCNGPHEWPDEVQPVDPYLNGLTSVQVPDFGQQRSTASLPW